MAGLALLVVASGVWLSAFPPGADAPGHLFRAEYLAGQMREAGPGLYFQAAWLPDWYMGDPLRTYYPPLTNLLLTPFVYLTADPILGYRLFLSLVLAAFAALAYFALAALWSPWTAGLGTALALIAPYQVRTIYFEGNVPRVLALLALPVVLWAGDALLTTKGRRTPLLVVLAAAWAWAVLAHPQQAAMFAVAFGLYLVVRLFVDPDVPLRRAGYWLAGLVLGGLVTAPWAYPAYAGGELPEVPFLPVEKVNTFVVRPEALLPAETMADGRISLGFGALLLALLAASARPDPRRTALVVAGLLTAWMSLGPQGVAFSLLPLNESLLPERFLNFTAFALAVAAAGLFPLGPRARVARLFVIAGLAFIDLFPGLSLLGPRPYPQAEALLERALQASPIQGGRTYLLIYPEPSALEVYFAGKAGPLVNGWALENTPHHWALRRLPSAPEWSPAYFQRLLALYDVRRVVLAGEGGRVEAAVEALEAAGFRLEEQVGRYDLYTLQEESSPVQSLPAERMLVLGDRLTPFLAAFPFAEEADRPNLTELRPERLQAYPVVGVYRFEQSADDLDRAEAVLLDYLERGGRVVLDLSGMEEAYGRSLEFLGVDVLRLSFSEEMRLRWQMEGLPTRLPLGEVAPEGWSGATYSGLDGVLAEVAFNEEWYPVLGYKDIGQGRAWFIGLNLLYYAQLTGAQDLLEAVRERTLEGVAVARDLRYDPVPVKHFEAGPTGVSLEVEAPEDLPEAVVSYTYSPRWRVLVDGQEVPYRRFERLTALPLPRGNHTVVFAYQPYATLPTRIGLGLGALAVVTLLGLYAVERARFVPVEEAQPEAEQQVTPNYAPCANCGFLLAEVGPPTPITYPFQVVRCPIWGLRMDDEGFQPGEPLDDAAKRERLAAWLEAHGYHPDTVHERWGFAVTDFFGEPGQGTETVPAIEGEDVEPNPDRG